MRSTAEPGIAEADREEGQRREAADGSSISSTPIRPHGLQQDIMREQVSDMITHTAQHITYAILHSNEVKRGDCDKSCHTP